MKKMELQISRQKKDIEQLRKRLLYMKIFYYVYFFVQNIKIMKFEAIFITYFIFRNPRIIFTILNSMDRIMERTSINKTHSSSYQNHIIGINKDVKFSTYHLRYPLGQKMNTMQQNSLQQNSLVANQKMYIKGHRRGHSDDIRNVLRATENKQNFSHKEIDVIEVGEYEIRGLYQKLKTLEKRVEKTEKALFFDANDDKGKIDFHFDIVKVINQTMSHRLSQIDAKIQSFTQKMSEIKISQHIQNLPPLDDHSETVKIPQQYENLQKNVQIDQKLQSLYMTLKAQFQTCFSSIHEKIKKLSSTRQYQQALNIEQEFFRTNRKYSGNPISFLYEEYIRKKQGVQNQKNSFTAQQNEETEGTKIRINQITYYIDSDGFLLDNEGLYLVNQKSQQIKLSQKELRMLRKANILLS